MRILQLYTGEDYKLETSESSVKLVHITTVPWSLFFIRGQAGFMAERGVNVTIITSPGPALDAFVSAEGVESRGVEMLRAISPVRDVRAVVNMCRRLGEIRPTIVHAHTPKGGLIGMIAAWIMRTPVRIYHIRGLPYLTEAGIRRQLLRWSEVVSCKLAHEVLSVSESIRLVAIEDGLVAKNKIRVLLHGSGNGVDADGRFNPKRFTGSDVSRMRSRLGIPEDAIVILYLGRVVRDKGIEELIDAWQAIRARFSEAWLIVAGPQEAQDSISESKIEIMTQDDRVIMTGDVEDPAILFAISDLFVLPSHREGFGNVNIEAGAMELPVVSTRIPGCVDSVKDGVTGTLISPTDTQALELAIDRYLSDPELRSRHGKAGRARVLEQFRQEDIWEAMYQEYCRLLQQKQLSPPAPNCEDVPAS